MGFLERAEDTDGYPVWEFEAFYQQGLACFVWGLPKPLVRQAFKKLNRDWQAKGGTVAMWQVRAFVFGLSGRYGSDGIHSRRIPDDFQWPTPPDAAWELVVCIYPDGEFDLDLVHPVSRRFWSEDNGFFVFPTDGLSFINREWFEAMGFEVMLMQPALQVQVTSCAARHLKLI